ncbi:MAG: acyltransferase [Acidobacteriota bacterium]
MGVTGSAVPAREGAPSRLPGLDVLRAVAVLLVIGRHTMFFPPDASWPAPLASAMRVWIRGGWIGVDLFFVLSGFLVSGLLFREYQVHGRLRIGRFLLRRGLKIYPAFYTLIAASVCGIVVRQGCRSIPWREIAAESVFLQNYWAAYWWHTWSLAIEEHFYLLCALLLFALSRRSRGGDPFRAVPWGFVLVATVELVLRIGTALAPGPYQNATHLTPTHLRLDGLSFGVLLSYAYHFHRAWIETRLRGREGALALSGLAMLAPAFAFPLESTPFVYTAGFTLFWMGSGLLVVAVVLRGVPGGAASRGLAWSVATVLHLPLAHPGALRRHGAPGPRGNLARVDGGRHRLRDGEPRLRHRHGEDRRDARPAATRSVAALSCRAPGACRGSK